MSFQDYPTALRKESILDGRYIIQDVIGQGSFGITYKALDYPTDDIVAIKEYFPAAMSVRKKSCWVVPSRGQKNMDFAEGKKWFLREVRTLATFIGSPNMLKIYNYFEENGTAYFVMEYVSGVSLTEYIQNAGGRLPWYRTWELLLPVMDALTAIHSRNIIHRDIKPDNIVIMKDGNAKILDFGAARYSYGQQSHSLDVILTRGFAPLEQYYRRGKQGPWTDLYALAATMYSAVMGEIPPDAVMRQSGDALKIPVSIEKPMPLYAQDALLKALSIQPVERYGSVADFKKAILWESALEGGTEIEAQRNWIRRCQIEAQKNDEAARAAARARLEKQKEEKLFAINSRVFSGKMTIFAPDFKNKCHQ